MDYARISGGLVAEIVTVPDGAELAEMFHPSLLDSFILLPEGSAAAPGWRHEGGAFLPPVPPEVSPPTPIRVLTARQFRERFTRAERAAITLAASRALEQDDATLQVFLDDVTAAQEVELDHPDLLAGMDLLVTRDLVTAARAAEILSITA